MDHSVLNDQTYEIFSKDLHERASQNRMPISATVEITMRCNLHCQHCYIPLEQRTAKHPDELRLSEYERIFSEFADAGTFWLLFTGGEPFLRPDFLEIYDLAKQKGFIVTLFTNGTLINESIADHLAEWRPFNIEISLYGSTQQTYETVTGIPGSFNRCMQGIEYLLKRGLALKLKAPLMTLNAHELDEMVSFSNNLGVEFHFDPVITVGINGDTAPAAFRLPLDEIVRYELNDDRRASAWPEKIATYKGKNIDVPNMYTCGAGRTSFHMDAFGQLSLCLSARTPSYNLREGRFEEAWQDFFPNVLALEYQPDFECLDCPLRMICSQCPAMGLTEMGDPQVKVPFICQLAHLRAEAFGN